MGCVSSNVRHVDAVSQQVTMENASLVGSKAFNDVPESAVPRPRSKQRLSQNIVTENFDKDIRDYYDIDKQTVLGSGISGSVRICVHLATGNQYALKSLTKKKVKAEKLLRLKEEIQFMADLDHPNILRLNEYFETNDVIYLVLDLCRGGELLDRLHEQKGHHYSERIACKYVHTMLSAISYCHAHNIVHRDLKLENFLFENDTPDSELKLIGAFICIRFDNVIKVSHVDFGLSHYFAPQEVLHR
jgi:calcium-dependent protein kinase